MSLRDLLAQMGAETGRDRGRMRHLFQKYGVTTNPFPSSNESRDLPHLEGEVDRQIAERVRVFQTTPHRSQVILIQGTQGVGKTNLLDWYEKQFEELLSEEDGYTLIRYYPDPDPSFDLILHRIFDDLQQNQLLEALGNSLSQLGEDEFTEVIQTVEHADFRALLRCLRAAAESGKALLSETGILAVEWMVGMRLLRRHRDALGVRMRLDTLEGKTRVLRDLVKVTGKLNLLHGIFLLLDELEKLDQTVSKVAVTRFLLAVRALIDALPHNLFLMLAMTPSARDRYFSFVPALAARLQIRLRLEPIRDEEEAISLYDLYLTHARNKARSEGELESWTPGDDPILTEQEVEQVFQKLRRDAERFAIAGVTQRQFLHHIHLKAEEKLSPGKG